MFSNDAVQDGTDFVGDPVDAALLRAAQRPGWTSKPSVGLARSHEFTFDNARKRMSTVSLRDGAVGCGEGAPESVLAQCTQQVEGHQVIRKGCFPSDHSRWRCSDGG